MASPSEYNLPLRPRRLRRTENIRRMARETRLATDDLIAPLFVMDGDNEREEVSSMPGTHRHTIDRLVDKAETLDALGIPAVAKVVLFFGTPRLHKGVGALADAVDRIEDPDFRLVVVGSAPDRSVTQALEQKAPGRVIMVESQPFGAIPEIMACADVVALYFPERLIKIGRGYGLANLVRRDAQREQTLRV